MSFSLSQSRVSSYYGRAGGQDPLRPLLKIRQDVSGGLEEESG